MARHEWRNARFALCDSRLAPSRSSWLPTYQYHAVPTCEYQIDSSSKQPAVRGTLPSLFLGAHPQTPIPPLPRLDRSTHIRAKSIKLFTQA
jgi:hypothetical protein